MTTVISNKYKEELESEVNEFREMNGRDTYPSDDDDTGDGITTIDEATGEIISKKREHLQTTNNQYN